MYLVEWNGGREIVGSIADVLQHPKLSIATVFERHEFGIDEIIWIAC
jgi:small nuclear ribonucleoprotein (snRNP)-like protein